MVFFSKNRLSSDSLSARPPAGAALNLTSDAIGQTNLLSRRVRASDQGGNTLSTATLIPTPGKKRIVDKTSRRDIDFFRLDITTPVTLRINLRNRSSATLVTNVLDSQGQIFSYLGIPLKGTVPPDRRVNNLYTNVLPGTYYLQISTRSRAASQYELKLSVTDPTAPQDCGCGT